jgi:hypothetical protein
VFNPTSLRSSLFTQRRSLSEIHDEASDASGLSTHLEKFNDASSKYFGWATPAESGSVYADTSPGAG